VTFEGEIMATKIFVNLPVKDLEVRVCLSCEGRQRVDELVRKAVGAGGTTYNKPQDHGFSYEQGF
jgi:uncharacterized protein